MAEIILRYGGKEERYEIDDNIVREVRVIVKDKKVKRRIGANKKNLIKHKHPWKKYKGMFKDVEIAVKDEDVWMS